MKKVSIVVPCYNASRYLEKCIVYLLRQTIGIENIEIILVDDASTDDGATLDIIMRYEHQFPETIIAIPLEKNMRQGGARNVGILYATGEYIIFCDADDWMLEEALEHSYNVAKEYDVDVVEFSVINVKDRNAPVELVKGTADKLIEINTEEDRKNYFVYVDDQLTLGSQRKLCRLSMIRENNICFAENLIFEEPSFMLPLRLYERKHYFLDETLYVYYRSEGSTVRGEWGEHKWDNPKVWMWIMNDMKKRGKSQVYHSELEYLFFMWGFGLSIRMILQKHYDLTKKEVQDLIDMILTVFPNFKRNKYIQQGRGVWKDLMITLFDLEITDESITVINTILKKYI